jgi:hypothetical protein
MNNRDITSHKTEREYTLGKDNQQELQEELDHSFFEKPAPA